jgi:hypothetical protein
LVVDFEGNSRSIEEIEIEIEVGDYVLARSEWMRCVVDDVGTEERVQHAPGEVGNRM